ncbi:MAG: histidine phosphatase family protein [Rhizobiales bacterium]|nr:histidine phosphatase family protein [Hyphomicrobiales bacterium]
MLNLMLLRHAKASELKTGREDIDRPLTGRGKRAAMAMGHYMKANGLVPGLVLCSPAVRAKGTWDLVAKELGASPKVLFEQAIYDFGDGEELLNSVRRHAKNEKSVLLVGHNPSTKGLALRLAHKGDKKIRGRLETKYPTAALAVIKLDVGSWAAVAEGSGTLARFVRPRDIMDGP